MYPQNISSIPNDTDYPMYDQTLGSEDGTNPNPQIDDPEEFCSWVYPGGRDYVLGTSSLSSPLLAPVTHNNARCSFPYGSASLQVPAEVCNSIPHLNPYAYVDTSASPLILDSFERSTAASEYHYSGEYESEVAQHMHMLTREGSYSPSSEAQPCISPPNPLEIQEMPFESYLHVHPRPGGTSHRPSSSCATSSQPNNYTETNMRAGVGEVALMSAPAALNLDSTHDASRGSPDPEMGTIATKKPKTRKPFEPERRLEVRRVRQTGACFRCRWLKKPCGVGTPCPQCVNVRGRVWTYPCMRVNMTDLTGLSDLGLQGHQRGFLNSSILGWTGTQSIIQITHGFGGFLSITAEEIIPRDVEALVRKWPPENKRPYGTIWRWFEDSASSGRCYETTTMPYAIRKFQISETELDIYLSCDRGHRPPNSVPGVHADSLYGSDFTKVMIKSAWDYAETTGVTMIKKALRVKNAVYLQNYFLQCEVNSAGETGARVVAPAFVQIQLDLLIDGRRAELEKEVLTELQRTVFSRQRKCWLSIFFTIFILLTTLEEILWSHQAWRTKGFSSTNFSYERAQEIADVFLAVFRAMNQGSRPFIKLADGGEIVKVLNEEYGPTTGALFNSVAALISTQLQGPLLLQRKDAVFDFRDQFCLEGKFTSLLLLL